MKKILTIAFLVASFCVHASEADYLLYWQIAENEIEGSLYAKVGIKQGDTKTYLADATSGKAAEQLNGQMGTSEAFTSVIGTSLPSTSYSFFVELFDAKDSLWTSSFFAYTALAEYISTPASGSSPGSSATGIWQISATSVIPEPTSGMLMLLGLAGLALRRRKQVVA